MGGAVSVEVALPVSPWLVKFSTRAAVCASSSELVCVAFGGGASDTSVSQDPLQKRKRRWFRVSVWLASVSLRFLVSGVGARSIWSRWMKSFHRRIA